MRIEKIDFDNYNIFLNSNYLKKVDLCDKEEISKYIKNFILSINYKLNINGFYKIIVYCNKKVGIFLKLIKMEDCSYTNSLDFRIIVNINSDFYFKTSDYFNISNFNLVRHYDNNYYCLISDDFNTINLCEWGNYIYGDELLKMLNNSSIL